MLLFFTLDQDHFRDMRSEVSKTKQAAVDAEWRGSHRASFLNLLFHFFISLLLILTFHRLRRLLEDALKQVLGVSDFEAKLVLEALNQGTEKFGICHL